MALSAVATTFVQQAGTGAQVVTINVQAKALIFSLASDLTAAGSTTAEFKLMHGFAAADLTQAVICATAVNVPSAQTRQDNTKCISIVDYSGTVVAAAALTAVGANDFTINWTTNDSIARVIHVFAIVGATNAIVLTGQVAAAPGVANYTGAGFQPDFIHTMTSGNNAAAVSTLSSFADMGLGYATSATTEAASSFDIDTGPGFEKVQVTDATVIGTDAGGGVYNRGDLNAMTADGFDINWTVTGAQSYFYTLCLKGGGSYKVGTFNQATSAGTQTVSSVGHLPTGVLLSSVNGAASASVITTDTRQTFGMMTGSSNRVAVWGGASGSSFNTSMSTNKAVVHLTEGAPTTNASGDYSAFASDSFSIAWDTADGTARQIIYASFGNAAESFDPANMAWIQPTNMPWRRRVEVIGT